MSAAERYDAIVIGAGQAGGPLASALARTGKRTVLGDVKGGPAFTHISYDDFRIIRTNLLPGGGASGCP